MPTGHVFIATSLDGYVARTDRTLDWLMKQPAEDGDTAFADFMKSVDGLIMGAGSFRTLLVMEEWPYDKPVIVMSLSMQDSDIPPHLAGKVRISDAPISALMEQLDRRGWKRVYVDGGRLVQSFLREGRIADLEITVVPILIGSGIRLFGALEQDIDLELVSTEPRKNGMVTLKYRVPGSA